MTLRKQQTSGCVNARLTLALGLLVLLLGPLWACAADTALNDVPAASKEPQLRTSSQKPKTDARYVQLSAPSDPALLSAPAVVVTDPESRSQVTSVARGQVVHVDVHLGQVVKKGQVLLSMRSSELLTASAQVDSSAAQIAAHQMRLDAMDVLQAEGLARRQETFVLRAKVAELQAAAGAANALLKAAGMNAAAASSMSKRGSFTLRASTDGVVSALQAVPGQIYDPFASPPLVEILGTGAAWIAVDLVRPPPTGVTATFIALDGQRLALQTKEHSRMPLPAGGFRYFYGLSVEASLTEGLMGQVHFEPDKQAMYQVPADALRGSENADTTYLLVRRKEGLQRIAVTVHGRSGTAALLSGALRADDLVAVGAVDEAGVTAGTQP